MTVTVTATAVRASARGRGRVRGVLLAIAAALVGTVVVPVTGGVAAAQPVERTVLQRGDVMVAGDRLVSPNGRFELALFGDGGLTVSQVYDPFSTSRGIPLASGVARLAMQSDGNLVGYSTSGAAVFVSRTAGTAATSLRVLDDRDLVLQDAAGRVVKSFATQRRGDLVFDEVLYPGDAVLSPDGAARLVMQTDGNLVFYRQGRPLWWSGSAGHPGAYARFQRDGNLVVYATAAGGGRALAQTGAHPVDFPRVGPSLRVENFELSLMIRDRREVPRVVWATAWGSDTLLPGDSLDAGDRRVSADGRCVLLLQHDLNLVQYCDGRAVFASRTAQPYDWSLGRFAMQLDGNAVLYRANHSHEWGWSSQDVGWVSNTSARGSRLVVQSDQNLVIYGPDGRARWSRLTGGHSVLAPFPS